MINRTIFVAMTIYMDMVEEYVFKEDDTVEEVLNYMIFSSGNSGNDMNGLLYLKTTGINECHTWNV